MDQTNLQGDQETVKYQKYQYKYTVQTMNKNTSDVKAFMEMYIVMRIINLSFYTFSWSKILPYDPTVSAMLRKDFELLQRCLYVEDDTSFDQAVQN